MKFFSRRAPRGSSDPALFNELFFESLEYSTASIIHPDGTLSPIPLSTITLPSTESEFEEGIYDILSDYFDYVPDGVLERLNVLIYSLLENKKK